MELNALLKGKPTTHFLAEELARKAHWRWDRGAHYQAFLLPDAALLRARQDQDTQRATTTRDRAAVTCFLRPRS